MVLQNGRVTGPKLVQQRMGREDALHVQGFHYKVRGILLGLFRIVTNMYTYNPLTPDPLQERWSGATTIMIWEANMNALFRLH